MLDDGDNLELEEVLSDEDLEDAAQLRGRMEKLTGPSSLGIDSPLFTSPIGSPRDEEGITSATGKFLDFKRRVQEENEARRSRRVQKVEEEGFEQVEAEDEWEGSISPASYHDDVDQLLESFRSERGKGEEVSMRYEPFNPTLLPVYQQIKEKDQIILQMEAKMMELDRKVIDLEDTLTEKEKLLVSKNDAVNCMVSHYQQNIAERDQEISNTQATMLQLEKNFSAAAEQWKTQLGHISAEQERKLQQISNEATAKIQQLEKEKSNLADQLEKMSSSWVEPTKVSQIEQEKLDLLSQLEKSLSENDSIRAQLESSASRINELEQRQRQLSEHEEKVKELESQLTKSKEQVVKMKLQFQAKLKAARELRVPTPTDTEPPHILTSKISQLEQEKSELTLKLEQVILETDSKTLQLEQENFNLMSQLNQASSENGSKMFHLEQENTNLGIRMEEMTSEYESKRDELEGRIFELEQGRKRTEEAAEERIKELESQLAKSKEQMSKMKLQFQAKLKAARNASTVPSSPSPTDPEGKITQLENRVAELEEEKGNWLLQMVDNDEQQAQRSVPEETSEERLSLEITLSEREEEVRKLHSQLAELTAALSQKNGEVEQLMSTCSDMEESLQKNIQELSTSITTKDEEITSHITAFEQKLSEKDAQVEDLKEKLVEAEAKFQEIKSTVEEYQGIVEGVRSHDQKELTLLQMELDRIREKAALSEHAYDSMRHSHQEQLKSKEQLLSQMEETARKKEEDYRAQIEMLSAQLASYEIEIEELKSTQDNNMQTVDLFGKPAAEESSLWGDSFKISQLEQERADLTSQLEQVAYENESKLSQLEQEKFNLDQRVKQIESHYQQSIAERDQEISNTQAAMLQLEKNFSAAAEQWKIQLGQISAEQERKLQQISNEASAKIQQLEKEKSNLADQLEKISSSWVEPTKVSQLEHEKSDLLSQLEKMASEAELSLTQLEQNKLDLLQRMEQIESHYQQSIAERDQEISNTQATILELERNLSAAAEQWKIQLEQISAEHERKLQQISIKASAEIQQLEKEKLDLEEQLEELSSWGDASKIAQLEQEKSDLLSQLKEMEELSCQNKLNLSKLEYENNELQDQLGKVSLENDAARFELNRRIAELEINSSQDAEEKIKELESQLTKSKEQVSKMKLQFQAKLKAAREQWVATPTDTEPPHILTSKISQLEQEKSELTLKLEQVILESDSKILRLEQEKSALLQKVEQLFSECDSNILQLEKEKSDLCLQMEETKKKNTIAAPTTMKDSEASTTLIILDNNPLVHPSLESLEQEKSVLERKIELLQSKIYEVETSEMKAFEECLMLKSWTRQLELENLKMRGDVERLYGGIHEGEGAGLKSKVLQDEVLRLVESLHDKDNRCEQLTLEITKLLEERDGLQLKLSTFLRTSGGDGGGLSSIPHPCDKDGLEGRLAELEQNNYSLQVDLRREREARRIVQEQLFFSSASKMYGGAGQSPVRVARATHQTPPSSPPSSHSIDHFHQQQGQVEYPQPSAIVDSSAAALSPQHPLHHSP